MSDREIIEQYNARIIELEAANAICRRDITALEADLVAMQAERDALKTAHKRFNEVLNDAHDVPPEHDSEPVPFHKGWELAIRCVAAALTSPQGGQKA